MMNVRNLIDALDRCPGDMPVMVDGYEQGYDELSPERICVATVALNTGRYCRDGKHGDIEDLPAGMRT